MDGNEVSGTLNFGMLYRTADEASIEYYQREIPFTEYIEIAGAESGMEALQIYY